MHASVANVGVCAHETLRMKWTYLRVDEIAHKSRLLRERTDGDEGGGRTCDVVVGHVESMEIEGGR